MSISEQMRKQLRLLVETLEVSLPSGDEDLTLRVEIFESLDSPLHFSARVWRIESFRIQATFPQVDGVPAHAASDELILKEFEGFYSPLLEPKAFPDRVFAREHVLEHLAKFIDSLQVG